MRDNIELISGQYHFIARNVFIYVHMDWRPFVMLVITHFN